jgi:hypothetical protein
MLCCAVLQALAAETERRQAAVWAPQPDSADAELNPQQRQQRLKTARAVLSQRLQQQRQQQFQQAQAGLGMGQEGAGGGQWSEVAGGGFMADGAEGFVGDECWESGVLKRQRL